jgi:O-antigen/teichoic acid export membrane protein
MNRGGIGPTTTGAASAPRPEPVRGATTIVSDYSSVLGTRIASVALSFAAIVVTTRILGPTGVGTVAYVTILATLVFTVGSAWTSSAVARYGREEFERRGEMTAVTWERLVVTLPLLAIAAGLVVGLRAAGWLPRHLDWALVWAACAYGAALVLSDHLVYVLQAVGRMKLSALVVFARQLVVVVALAAILAADAGARPLLVVVVITLSWLALTPLLAASVWHAGIWPPRRDPLLRRRIFLFSLPLIAFTVSQYVIQTIDFAIIGAYRGREAVGVYSVAYQGYNVLQNVAAAVVSILTPLFVSLRVAGREELVGRFLERVVPQLTFVAACAAGVVAPFIPLAVPPIFGESFADAADPLALLLVPAVLLVAANLLAPVIVLHEATRPVGWISLAAAALNVVGDVVLIGVFGVGIIGAAVATTLSILCIVVGYDRLVARRLGLSARLGPLVFAPLVVGVAAALLLPAGAAAATGWLLALAAAVGVLFFGRVFGPEDAAFVQHLPAPLRRPAHAFIARVARS